MIRARWAAPAVLAALLAGGPASGRALDYLYIEPNVGTASGGHVALRIGDFVYHYQHSSDGTLRMSREEFDTFDYVYSVLQNRTIHLARIEADHDTRERLRERFNRRLIVQRGHLAVQESLRNDRLLLELVLARAEGAEPSAQTGSIRIRGPRFFFDPDGTAEAGTAPPLAELRERLRRERGEDFLSERILSVERELRGLAPPTAPTGAPVLSADRLPPRATTWSDRFVDLTTRRLALQVLERALPVRFALRADTSAPEFELSEPEQEALRVFARRQERDLVALLDSKRSDPGYPLLVGLARLVVLDESIRSGRLVVLDGFPAGALAIPGPSLGRRSAFIEELRDWGRREFEAERAGLFAEARIRERHYAALESATNRYAEVARGLATGRDIRVYGEHLIPHGDLTQREFTLLPELDARGLRESLQRARRREREHAEAFAELYRYDLISRNCVTEIFETINGTFDPSELEQRIGKRIDPGRAFNFWPRVAFGSVKASYRVAEVGEIPSFRRTRLAQMSARENPLKVHLREANTLTSTIYRPNPRDSFFLFFTDDAAALRPIYGVANLLAGLGQTAVGLFRLPFDRGRAVVQGAKGIFFSFPELAFINIRKGTFEYGRGEAARTRLRTEVR